MSFHRRSDSARSSRAAASSASAHAARSCDARRAPSDSRAGISSPATRSASADRRRRFGRSVRYQPRSSSAAGRDVVIGRACSTTVSGDRPVHSTSGGHANSVSMRPSTPSRCARSRAPRRGPPSSDPRRPGRHSINSPEVRSRVQRSGSTEPSTSSAHGPGTASITARSASGLRGSRLKATPEHSASSTAWTSTAIRLRCGSSDSSRR